MNLLKTSFYTSISTAVTFICGFIVAKVVAVKIGPAGIALVGQYQNVASILTMLGSGAIGVGVVKLMAEHTGNREKQTEVAATAFSVVLVCSLVMGIATALFSARLSTAIFNTPEYAIVFVLLGLSLIFISGNTVALNIFNGLKQIRFLTISNICFSLLGIAFTVLGAKFYGVKGVLLAASVSALTLAAINIFLLRKTGIGHIFRFPPAFDKTVVKRLLSFALMSAVTSFLIPISQFMIRTFLITRFTKAEAGYWQGVTKISDYYLSFITTVLSVYYLPRLSELHKKEELRREIFRGYKIIVPVVGAMALTIALCRHWIILILYSPEFLPMKPLFTFQMLGDFIKISSWLLGFLMWAKGMTKTFIFTEVFFTFSFTLLAFLFVSRYGVIGTTYAFALNYTLYMITMIFVMRKVIY